MDILSDPGRLIETYGVVAIFAVMFFKEAGVPIPLPGDVLMILAGAQAATGTYGLVELLIAVQAAATLGPLIQYVLARGPARRFFYRYGRYVGLSTERLDRTTAAV